MSLTVEDFPAFFTAVHGYEPYVWQQRLCERVCSGAPWPAALDVPTGLGKTAALDVAVFALALQAGLPPRERTAATRTIMVVDRRVIVDQSHERARHIADELTAAQSGPVAAVAAALRSLAGPRGPALEVVRMRGGVEWASRWLQSPRQPAIVTGTVDQLGSRLLFRGYGVTRTMRPVDAALCGTDSLLLLDEAHLAQPFLQTVSAASAYEQLAEQSPLPDRRARGVLLSATTPQPADGSLTDVLRCDEAAETAPSARARLDAVKDTVLLSVNSGERLAEVLADLAVDAVRDDVQRVLVVVNTVPLARAAHGELAAKSPLDTALLLGRCREVERENNARAWLRDRLVGPPVPAAEPVIVVATQTVEVGADIDVDVLITEACPLDALVQRLGRLDRAGRRGIATAVVVHDPALHDGGKAAVYGPATARTWQWLVQAAGASSAVRVTAAKAVSAARTTGLRLDLGPQGATTRLAPAERGLLSSEPPPAPVVLSPVLDLWTRTSPEPVPDQPVAPFLHGISAGRPEVRVCWRDGIPEFAQAPEAWAEELRVSPVRAHETVSVSYAEALRVLGRNLSRRIGSGDSDVEGVGDDEDDNPFGETIGVTGWVLLPDGTDVPLGPETRLRPDSTIVLDSRVGGHDEWGWTGRLDGVLVRDVGDRPGAGPWRLRLRPELWRAVPVSPDLWAALEHEERDDVAVWTLLSALHAAVEGLHDDREEILAGMLSAPRQRVVVHWSTHCGPTLVLPRARAGQGSDVGAAGSSLATRPVGLGEHLADVEARAGEEARALGLSPELVAAVALAGWAHDLGKADQRFQLVLHAGNRYRLELAKDLLAKSGLVRGTRDEERQTRRSSGWPPRMRHESVSVALVRDLFLRHAELFEDVDTELVEHLVASHHGHSRPLLPPVLDTPHRVTVQIAGPDGGAMVTAEADSSEVLVDWTQPTRFARLNARYGRWGLALLETILRLADMQVSAEYDGGES